MRKTALILASCVAVAFLFAAPDARAQGGKKIILFDFDGKGSGAARDKLVKGLIGEGYSITPRKEAKATASDMGYASTPGEAGGMLAVAKALNVDAFVYGKVKAKGKSRELSLTVAATCEDGIVHNLEYEWTGKQMPPDTLNLAVSQVIEEIDSAQKSCWAPPEPAPGEEVEEEEAPKKKGGGLTLVKGPGGKHCGKIGGFRCGLPYAMTAHLRAALTSRKLFVELPQESADDGYKYEGSAYMLLGIDAKLNIQRLFSEHPMFSVVLGFAFAHSVALVSNSMDESSGSDKDIPTKDLRVNIGLALEIAPKPGVLPLWIFIDLGWGMHTFAVDFEAGENEYISDFNYGLVDIGVGLRYSIVQRWLDLKFRLGINIPYTLGDAETFYGAEATGKIGIAMPGIWLDGVIVYGLHWAVGFEYIYFKGDFKGEGTITNDGGPDSGKNFTDSYPTGYLLLGYRM